MAWRGPRRDEGPPRHFPFNPVTCGVLDFLRFEFTQLVRLLAADQRLAVGALFVGLSPDAAPPSLSGRGFDFLNSVHATG
jgi:hypothetical protein